MSLARLREIPFLGSGLGHRRETHDGILASRADVGFVEIIPEKYISASHRSLDMLSEIADAFVVIPHGVSLSVGTAGRVSPTFLRSIKQICNIVKPPYYSDHLAVTQTAGIDIGHLSPIQYEDRMLRSVIDNVNRVQDYVGLPFVIENITETHAMPGSTMDAAEFFRHLVDATGCGVLLDVTNIFTNAVNGGFDALEFACRMPLEAVVQVHLAGGIWAGDKLIDSHSQPIPDGVWSLFESLLPDLPLLKGSLIERDDNYPQFDDLLAEVRIASGYLENHRRLAMAPETA